MESCNKSPGWYLNLMVQNTKGPSYSWLDPSVIYASAQGFHDCIEDLVKPYQNEAIDMVAGIDGTGFILGSAIAHRLRKGFLIIRKGGHLCVDTDSVNYCDYQQKGKSIEMRKNAFQPGTRVLIIDQWVETGGTMKAAISLVEKQNGIVAGIGAICIEESDGGKELKKNYKFAHCTPPHMQEQINKQHLECWDSKS